MKKTGWPQELFLMQDDCSKLSRWFASRPDARYQIRMMFPKFNYFRSKQHLKNVAELPCQNCYIEGQTQAAHSNWAEHGKGRGIKSSDEFTAALCQKCHTELDQGARLTKEQRRMLWQMAYQKTVGKLKASGKWPSELE